MNKETNSENAEHSVIDLTNSFVLADHDNLRLSNVVTIILDDSTDESVTTIANPHKRKIYSTQPALTSTPNRVDKPQKNKTLKKQKSLFGDCPICWEELGTNPMASTICGHVFCHKCLKNARKNTKACPTCRHDLRDKHACHRLYLNIN